MDITECIRGHAVWCLHMTWPINIFLCHLLYCRWVTQKKLLASLTAIATSIRSLITDSILSWMKALIQQRPALWSSSTCYTRPDATCVTKMGRFWSRSPRLLKNSSNVLHRSLRNSLTSHFYAMMLSCIRFLEYLKSEFTYSPTFTSIPANFILFVLHLFVWSSTEHQTVFQLPNANASKIGISTTSHH